MGGSLKDIRYGVFVCVCARAPARACIHKVSFCKFLFCLHAYYLHCQLVVKPVQQNKGVEERNRRDIEAEERRVNPEVSLASKTQQVARLLASLVLLPSPHLTARAL